MYGVMQHKKDRGYTMIFTLGTIIRSGEHYYQLKERLHKRLFLAEELEYIENDEDFIHTGREKFFTAWELERFAEIL